NASSPQTSTEPDTGEMVAEDGSSCVSRLFYLWLNPLLRRGQRGDLERPQHVYHLPWKLRTAVVWRYFHRCWEACGSGAGMSGQQDQWPRPVSSVKGSDCREGLLELEGDVRLLRVLHKAFGLRYYILGVLKVTVNISSFAGPLLLSSLVSFIEEKGAPFSKGVICVLGLFATTLLSSVLRNIYVFQISKISLSARASLVSAIYGKALQVSSCSLAGFTLGEVVNLMSTDTDQNRDPPQNPQSSVPYPNTSPSTCPPIRSTSHSTATFTSPVITVHAKQHQYEPFF
uniref:ABC transmembrane type-1 domain-containing protein n=1 Tax=Cyprinodon variegatus TaxID=28743 RepID=A0A3Q2EAQ4_CYPVA